MIIGIGGATLSGALSSLASKAVTDLIDVTLYGGEFGDWEDYALAFVFGGFTGSLNDVINKGGKLASKLAKAGKFFSDVALRPAATQLLKNVTRGKTFDSNKFISDMVFRTVTYGSTNRVMNGKLGSTVFKVDIGKSANRATMNAIYDYLLKL